MPHSELPVLSEATEEENFEEFKRVGVMNDTRDRDQAQAGVQVMDPPFARALFGNTVWSWLWLVVRVYVGYSWISAGLEKFSNPAWMQTGTALKGFW